MGISKENGMNNAEKAVRLLLSIGAIKECKAGGVYHNTGKYVLMNDIISDAKRSWKTELQDELFVKMVQQVFEDCPDEENCSFCHSSDELE